MDSNNLAPNISTWVVCALIVICFLFLFLLIRRLKRAAGRIKAITSSSDIKGALSQDNKLQGPAREYFRSLIPVDGRERTTAIAEDYFNEAGVCLGYGINIRYVEAGAAFLVGLGLLGTFLGLTLSLGGMNTTQTSEEMTKGVKTVLAGSQTAFITSLSGMFFSLIYMLIAKRTRRKIDIELSTLCQKLDDEYFISEAEYLAIKQEERNQILMNTLTKTLTYISDDGERVGIGSAMCSVLEENEKQTKALSAFSSQLAIFMGDEQARAEAPELAGRFTKNLGTLIDRIDNMANAVTQPTTETMGQLISELKTAMDKMLTDFKQSVTGDTNKELTQLIGTLSTTAEAISSIPGQLKQVTESLTQTISDANTSIANTSEASKGTAEKMAEAINASAQGSVDTLNAATGKLSSLIGSIEAVLQKFIEASATAEGSLTSMAQAQKDAKEATDSLGAASRNLHHGLEIMVDTQKSADKQVSETRALLTDTEKTTNEYANRFTVIQTGAAGIFEKITAGTQDYKDAINNSIRSYLDTFGQKMGEALAKVAGIVSMLQQILDELKEERTGRR